LLSLTSGFALGTSDEKASPTHLLDGMNAADRVIVVGIHSGDRMGQYTKPGYKAYARSVVEELKPRSRGASASSAHLARRA
jgi:hypothetical protein